MNLYRLFTAFKLNISISISLIVILLSAILLHWADLASALGTIVLAGLYVIVAMNIAPRCYAIATPVLYIMTITLLSFATMFPEVFYQTPWTKFGQATVSPIWFAGTTVVLAMSFLYSWKKLSDIKKAGFFDIAITALLVLVASSDIIRALLLAVAVCCTFHACGIGKNKLFFNYGVTLSGVVLYLIGVALVGHNPFGGFNIQYDSCILLRIVPVLASVFVVYKTTQRLRNKESIYIKLLGIGSAFILVAESMSDVASSMLSLDTYSSVFIHSALYGIILSCIGNVVKSYPQCCASSTLES